MAVLHSTCFCITVPWLYFTLFHCILVCHGSTSLYFTFLYHDSTYTWFDFTLHDSTMALLESTSLYMTTIAPLNSALLYHGSTSLHFTLHYSTMALLFSTSLCITLPLLYLTLIHSRWFYHGSIHHSTLLNHCSTWHYFTQDDSTMALHDSTLLYHCSNWLYFTQDDLPWLYLTLHYTILWLHLTLLHSTMALLDSTGLTLFYHHSTSLYFNLHDSTIALLDTISLKMILPWVYLTLHYSTIALLDTTSLKMILPWLYLTLHYSILWLYFTLLQSTWLYNCSTWHYFTQDDSTMCLLDSTLL